MTDSSSDATFDLLRGMLLGKLAEEEREDLEERLLHDGKLYEDFLEVETSLLDELARDELPPKDVKRLERLLSASAEGRAKLEVARSLAAGDLGKSGPGFRLLRFPRGRKILPLAAILALTFLSGWLASQNRHLSRVNETLRATVETEPARLELALALLARRSEDVEIPTLELLPEPQSRLVLLELDLRGLPDHDVYRVIVLDDRDEIVYAQAGLVPMDSEPLRLQVEILQVSLPAGTYELTLEGALVDRSWKVVSEASFRIRTAQT